MPHPLQLASGLCNRQGELGYNHIGCTGRIKGQSVDIIPFEGECCFHPILHHVTYSRDSVAVNLFLDSACSDHNGTPDKSGPMALNQFRPSVPVWSKTLWQTFVKHVAIST